MANNNDDEFKIDTSLDFIDDEFQEISEKDEGSDLDTFFEDLSNLDNEEKTDSPKPKPDTKLDDDFDLGSEASPSLVNKASPRKTTESSKIKIKKKKKQTHFLKRTFFFIITFSILGLGVYYFILSGFLEGIIDDTINAFQESDLEKDLEENLIDEGQPEPNIPIIVEPTKNNTSFDQPSSVKNGNQRLGPIHAQLSGKWKIQIATCSYKECIRNFESKITQLGYLENDLTRSSYKLSSRFLKIYIADYFTDPKEANRKIQKINKKNTLGLKAYPQTNEKGEIRIFIGNIPNDKEATQKFREIDKHVQNIYDKHFAGEEVILSYYKGRETLNRTRLYLGPYDSEDTAKKALKDIQINGDFSDAIIRNN